MKYELFKGYIRTANKKAAEKFKGVPLHTLDEIKECDEYAGVLNTNTVLVDVDEDDEAEVMLRIVKDKNLKCRVIRTTRGYHFLFLNNGEIRNCPNRVISVCGIKVDIKIGDGKAAYEVLKYKGKDRVTVYDTEEYQTVPKFCLPFDKKYDPKLFGMKEGDGRNDALYTHIIKCTELGIEKDSVRKIFREIINPYIFKKPLPDSELETVLRDESFDGVNSEKKEKKKSRDWDHSVFADALIEKYHIIRINGELHLWKNGVYIPGKNMIEAAMIKELPSIKQNKRNEAYSYINLTIEDSVESDPKYIAFKNGVLNIDDMVLKEPTPDMIVTNKIPWNYNPAAYSELCDKTLDKLACRDKQIRALLEECLGYCFYRRNEMSKSFILTGEKSNGKSTYLKMVETALGQDNFVNLDLTEFTERFSVGEMNGVLANVGDDISDDFLSGKAVSSFKKVVSGNRVKGEFKGQDVFFFEPYVKMLFSANDIPRIRDKTGAVLRRMIIIPFNAVFTKNSKDFNPYIVTDLTREESIEYFIRIGVEGLRRVLQNKEFTQSTKVEKALEEYDFQNNPILSFTEDFGGPDEMMKKPVDEVYSAYKVFCVDNGFTEVTKTSFSQEMKRKYSLMSKVEKKNGRTYRIFVKQEENTLF